MNDLYTNYATSVALRDAGAPQGDYADAECYYCSACGKEYLGTPENGWRRLDSIEEWCGCGVHRTHARAFRADEIIVALGDRLDAIDRYGMPGATYRIALSGERGSHVADSLVEALAAAWLAVLKEVKK